MLSGIVKTCHHAVFNEAWYLQESRPPVAQLLYDLGLEADVDDTPASESITYADAGVIAPVKVDWPPLHVSHPKNGL